MSVIAKGPGRKFVSDSIIRNIGILFFFSGFPALLYQLVWQRALFRIFGVNLEAVTIVVTAFMVGLGLGSLAGGWLSKYRAMPVLLVLAAIELVTALFGVFSLSIFDRVGVMTTGLPLWGIGVVSLALVIVPTVLMGATLPLLSEHLARRSGNTGYSVGLLYFVNTLGAASACFAGLALLFPFGGMQFSIFFAVLVNVVVALAAFGLHRQSLQQASLPALQAVPAAEPASGEASRAQSIPTGLMLALGALAGFVALSYEIYLFRIMSFMTGGLAPAFAAVLGIFLLGIAYGSREIARLAKSDPDAMGQAVLFQLAIATLAGLGLLPLVAWMATIKAALAHAGIMLGIYIIARSWGMVLPYLAHMGIRAGNNTGRSVSWLYLANIIGSATGSILTGFVLLEFLPLVGVARVLTLYSVLTIAVLYLSLGGKMQAIFTGGPVLQPALMRMPAMLLGGAAIVVLLAVPFDRKEIIAQLMLRERAAQSPELAIVHESRSGIITVDKKGEVWGNGMYDGKFNTSLFPDTNGARRPYALSLFHPSPRHVLMIGLSTGSWAKIIANNPHVASLTVIEISKGYAELIAGQPQVRSILSNPKVKLIVDDGRRWMRANPNRKFDFVVQNTTWHFRANISNLLSKEYLAMVGGRLKPGGVFFFNTTRSRRAQRTACSIFPHGFRYNNHMAVSRRALNPDFQRWRRTLLSYKIDGARVVDLAKEQHRQGLAS